MDFTETEKIEKIDKKKITADDSTLRNVAVK